MIGTTLVFLSLVGLLPFFNRGNIVAASRLRYISSPLLFLILLLAVPAQAAQTDIAGPAGSVRFGQQVRVLPNGNFVVNDPGYSIPGGAANVGAVYLYDGATLKIISTLTGSTADDGVGNRGITVLTNGNFVVSSDSWDNPTGPVADVGAVTWCSATTGCNGVVTVSNSLIGGTADAFLGSSFLTVTVLTNGNYVVSNSSWDNPMGSVVDVGAARWCSGTTGCSGGFSASNSLIGGTAGDSVGDVTALTNGNYVVSERYWDNPSPAKKDVGAVTWGNGAGGTVGLVTSSNSLVGGTANDHVGSRLGVTVLTNGNYVVSSPYWTNPTGAVAEVGAVTWGNGSGGTVGLVTPANSLIGGTIYDRVGYGWITALSNGNYVVGSGFWDNPVGSVMNAGAATWGNGTGGTVGPVTVGNSLIGGTEDDQVGASFYGVMTLTNGNYVVSTMSWHNPNGSFSAGAVTWGNGSGGTVGVVTSNNSLVGGTTHDQVGLVVTPLSNGNYVVSSQSWDNPAGSVVNAGALTWGSGTGGTVGLVTPSNSLIGGTASDRVGMRVRALSNGNYVVGSPSWDNPAGPVKDVGAVTWGNGKGTMVGLVSPANSLIGGSTNDSIASDVTALTNGNYVVRSMTWDNPTGPVADVGAVTWGNGSGGTVGLVTPGNSLIGGTLNDSVGGSLEDFSFASLVALTNGNYAVISVFWDNPTGSQADAGAVTWGNGSGGTVGLVTSNNSLVGGTANDTVGGSHYFSQSGEAGGVEALANGNYVVNNPYWHDPAGPIPGAVTFGNGTVGTAGLISSANSVRGSKLNYLPGERISPSYGFSYDATRNRLVVGRPVSNIVSIFSFETTAITDGNLDNAATWDNGVPTALVNAVIPAGRTVSVNTPTTIGALSVANGATLTMNADLNVTGSLTLGGKINTGAKRLGLSCSTIVAGASSSNYIIGSVRKEFCASGTFEFPVGTTNGYSPVTAHVTALTVNPSSLTVKTVQGPQPNIHTSAGALQRYWTLAGSGITADLKFNYLDSDVPTTASEGMFTLFKYNGSFSMPGGSVDTTLNQATINGVTSYSDWTLAQPNAVSGQPVVLQESAVTLTTWKYQGRIYAYVRLTFPDADFRVADFGSPVRSGSDFSADARVEHFIDPTVQSVTTTAQIYDLGLLADGTYTFTFKNSGTAVKALIFTVSSATPPANPIDAAREFVKQQYRDFLNREADQAGEDFWTDNITKCSDPARRPPGQNEAQCTLRQRETTSAAFFLSPEFQYTGYFVYRMYQGALGRQPKLSEFTPDAQFVGAGIIVNGQLSGAKINQNKADFAAQFANCTDPAKYRCAEFKAIYDGLNNTQYVDKLFQTTGVNASAADRAALVNGLNATPATETRASVLQKVVDSIVVISEGNQQFTTSYGQAFYNSEFNRAFVQLEYFGYMKRDPDEAGYAFWLGKLNQFGGNFVNAEMVLAFISSPEYRARFGQP